MWLKITNDVLRICAEMHRTKTVKCHSCWEYSLMNLLCNCNYTNLVACFYMCNCWMSAYTTSAELTKHAHLQRPLILLKSPATRLKYESRSYTVYCPRNSGILCMITFIIYDSNHMIDCVDCRFWITCAIY